MYYYMLSIHVFHCSGQLDSTRSGKTASIFIIYTHCSSSTEVEGTCAEATAPLINSSWQSPTRAGHGLELRSFEQLKRLEGIPKYCSEVPAIQVGQHLLTTSTNANTRRGSMSRLYTLYLCLSLFWPHKSNRTAPPPTTTKIRNGACFQA